MADCFVTGGTGFIGHHIVKQLNEEQHDITVLIREDSSQELLEGLDYQTVVGDVTNLDWWKSYRILNKSVHRGVRFL